MKKIFLLFAILFSCIISPSFATDSLEHFKTLDGRHMCSIFMKDDFKLCSEFGIEYEGDTVVSGEKPFFSAGFPSIETIQVADEVFCVEGSAGQGGYEVDKEKCKKNVTTQNPATDVSKNTVVMKSNCTLNGQSVDCAEMAETAGFWLKMGLWGFLIFGVLFLVGGIFWLMMLIHALSNPIPNKIMWVAVIFFISLVGAIIYYFVIKRKCVAVFVPPVVTQTVPNTSPVPTAPTTMQSSVPMNTNPIPMDIPAPVVVPPSVPVTPTIPAPPVGPVVPSSPTL